MPSSADSLLGELSALAAALGPAFAPTGSEELLGALTETARQLFGAAACSIALVDEATDELVYTTAAGAGAADITGMRLPLSAGVAGFVVQSGQPVAVSDLQRDPRFARDVAEATGYLPTAILAVPVMSPRSVLGVLSLLDRDPTRPGAERDIETASLFASQAALAIEGAAAARYLGAVLLGQLSEAATAGSDLADVLRTAAAAETATPAAGAPNRDLVAVAALLGDLNRHGPRELRLALLILHEVLTYVDGRSSRPGP